VTVFDASISLYGWFAENDTFVIDQCLQASDKKVKGKALEDLKAAFKCALNQLEKMDLISKSEIGEKEIWVLQRNYLTVEQEVKVSADTALSMAEIINNFCDMIDDHRDACNPATITEKDIKNLIHISSFYMAKN